MKQLITRRKLAFLVILSVMLLTAAMPLTVFASPHTVQVTLADPLEPGEFNNHNHSPGFDEVTINVSFTAGESLWVGYWDYIYILNQWQWWPVVLGQSTTGTLNVWNADVPSDTTQLFYFNAGDNDLTFTASCDPH